MKKFDFIIVGQGLAGTILGYTLRKQGARVFHINKLNAGCASAVAAGIFNPITGKKMVLTWFANQIFPFLKDFYRNFESDLGTDFFYPLPVFRPYVSVEEQNYWQGKMAEEEIGKFIYSESVGEKYESHINAPFGGFEIEMAGWLNIPVMLNQYREKIIELGLYEECSFDYTDFKNEGDVFRWNEVESDKIIFCEGSAAVENPFFNWLPFSLNRGDILTIESESLPSDRIVNKGGVFIVPLGNGRFRTGATYDRNFTNPGPSAKGKEELLEKLNKILKVPFSVIEHHSGVRPAVKDRRPLLGEHPEIKNMFIFNGLGAKGVSLAPYFAEQLAKNFFSEKEPDKDVNIRRFYTLYTPASQS